MKALLLTGALLAAPLAARAQTAAPLPTATPLPSDIPAAVDQAYPGTITLAVDATDADQGLFRVTETIPVAKAGPMVLLYPQWKPGNHAPSGQIKNVGGLTITADGKPVPWRRDTVDMFAFHVDVPAGATTLEARFQYLSPLSGSSDGRRVTAPTMLNLQWESVSLYPAGTYVRQIPVKASVTYPTGWTAYTALRGTKSGDVVSYPTMPYDQLVDSPVYAGKYTRQVALDPAVNLDLVADTPEELAITPDQIAKHKALIVQTDRLFGARHYDHYDFLVALSDYQSGDGLEHHRSSENTLNSDLLTDWDSNAPDRYVVAHEMTHSWNGKYRRPADLWTPDYRTPMQDSLLWVYEGQTQFWGDILAARSGLWSAQEYRDILANVAANYTVGSPGTQWRPLQDTTNDPIQTGHGSPSDWTSWSRAYDYYRYSALAIWLDADQIIRQQTGGRKGMDDFAKAFFGVDPGVWDRERTYTFDDVVATLNGVTPYDWAGFLRRKLDQTSPTDTLSGLEKAGYRLVFAEEPSATSKAIMAKRKGLSFFYSLGLDAKPNGDIVEVLWNGPAYKLGLSPNDSIVAVNGRAWNGDVLKSAVTAAKTGTAPIVLTVKNSDRFRTVSIDYHGGLRYPRLEKIGTGEAGLDRLIAPR